jgi:hypothetical protein
VLLRGFAKFVAVVLAAGLAGALIGIGLAKLSGDEATSDPVIPTTTGTVARGTSTPPPPPTATRTTPARPAPTTSTLTATTSAAQPGKPVYRVPRIQVLSAQLGAVDAVTGRALVAVSARLTNRGNKPLTIKTPVLISGADESPLGTSARDAAGALLKPIAPGSTAAGELRFTVTGAVARRLTADPGARLRLGNRTVALKLSVA